MTLDVVGSVLGNVSNTKSGVLIHRPLLRFYLSGQNPDECRLSGTVWPDDANTTRKGQSARRIIQAWFWPSGIGEGAVSHLQNRPRVAAHAHKRPRRRKRKLDRGGSQRVVRLGLGMFLDELR